MSEKGRPENKSRKIEKYYSEFSLDEFNSSYPITELYRALNADEYGFQFVLKTNGESLESLNKFIESLDLYDKFVDKKKELHWSADTQYLIHETSEFRLNKKPFLELDYNKQFTIKRLNRLLLEETYPKETPKSSKYFIPPGLSTSVEQFEYHYKVANGEPILIVGQTGVGKSLFSHIFEKLYREEHEDSCPIIKANCAHFSGDAGIVRSELFGHVKGAFTNAIGEKEGLVEMADGGVLILEEIGDLPLEAQTMLLTFIETGEFYRVGDKRYAGGSKKQGITGKPRRAKVQIVGLTNREEFLREDFNQRFFPFYVPPLCERRIDILYYLYTKFPDIIKTMTHREVLSLLAYNWPGNVREIERIGRLIQRDRCMMEGFNFKSKTERSDWESRRLGRSTSQYRTVNKLKVEALINDLNQSDVDVNYLDRILNHYRVGLKNSNTPAFSEDLRLYVLNSDMETSVRYGLKLTFNCAEFDAANMGFFYFCVLFSQNEWISNDIIDLSHFDLVGMKIPNLKKLGIIIPGESIEETEDKFNSLKTSLEKYMADRKLYFEQLKNIKKKEDIDISSLKHHDLLKLYCQKVYDREGTFEKAAKFAGLPKSTFKDDYDEYVRGIMKKKRNPTLRIT